MGLMPLFVGNSPVTRHARTCAFTHNHSSGHLVNTLLIKTKSDILSIEQIFWHDTWRLYVTLPSRGCPHWANRPTTKHRTQTRQRHSCIRRKYRTQPPHCRSEDCRNV